MGNACYYQDFVTYIFQYRYEIWHDAMIYTSPLLSFFWMPIEHYAVLDNSPSISSQLIIHVIIFRCKNPNYIQSVRQNWRRFTITVHFYKLLLILSCNIVRQFNVRVAPAPQYRYTHMAKKWLITNLTDEKIQSHISIIATYRFIAMCYDYTKIQ